MSGHATIKINPDSLLGLEDRIRALTELHTRTEIALLRGAPDVDRAYDDFVERWDDHRKRLFKSLDQIADMLKKVRDSFADTDESLATQLSGSGAGGPG